MQNLSHQFGAIYITIIMKIFEEATKRSDQTRYPTVSTQKYSWIDIHFSRKY